MKPAPWKHSGTDFMQWLARYGLPGRFNPQTNERFNRNEHGKGEELIEVFENEEYGGYGLRAKRRLCATDGDLVVCAVPEIEVLNRRMIRRSYGDKPNRYYELLELFDERPRPGLEIRLILLLQMVESHEPVVDVRYGGSNTRTLYVNGYLDKAFPKSVPVPSMWTEEEKKLLNGTSLQGAVAAKYHALQREFAELKQKTQNLPWAQEAFWKDNKLAIEDWFLIDAWCRSRSMDLPMGGVSMVPFIDLVNHSSKANVQYDQDEETQAVILKLKAGKVIEKGEELFINYGADKSASEMLFSYGFVEKTTLFEFLIGHIPNSVKFPAVVPNQDVKLESWGRRFGTPMLEIRGKKGQLEIESPFVYLLMLDQKDGLEMDDVVRPEDPTFHDIRAIWQGRDITDHLDNIEVILRNHPQKELFDIRVMFIYHALINHQMEMMQQAEDLEAQFDTDEMPADEQRVHKSASELRAIESTILDSAMDIVQDWVSSEKAQEWWQSRQATNRQE